MAHPAHPLALTFKPQAVETKRPSALGREDFSEHKGGMDKEKGRSRDASGRYVFWHLFLPSYVLHSQSSWPLSSFRVLSFRLDQLTCPM